MIRWRRLSLGLQTLLLGRKQGFFLPYRYAASVTARPAAPWLTARFDQAQPHFQTVLRWLDQFHEELARCEGPAPAPRWDQDWFPRLDGASAYAFVRHLAPRRIIEIGSGHSTRFMARAIADGGLATTLVSVDPAPRAKLKDLAIERHPCVVQDAPPEIFTQLAAGDILFIDSSHLAMPGSDVDVLFNEVIPTLKPGVFLHIHDVTLPDPYPEDWAWRGYNEQLLVPGLLTGGWDLRFASSYVGSRMAPALADTFVASLPLPKGARETSLWLEKT